MDYSISSHAMLSASKRRRPLPLKVRVTHRPCPRFLWPSVSGGHWVSSLSASWVLVTSSGPLHYSGVTYREISNTSNASVALKRLMSKYGEKKTARLNKGKWGSKVGQGGERGGCRGLKRPQSQTLLSVGLKLWARERLSAKTVVCLRGDTKIGGGDGEFGKAKGRANLQPKGIAIEHGGRVS